MRPFPAYPHSHHEIPYQLKGLMWQSIRGFANAAEIGNLRVIFDPNHQGWEHVSVSLASRTPTWAEMEFVKRSFWEPYETVMQLHVPEHKHVNNHPYCLHLWKPNILFFGQIPRPPSHLVG